MSSAPRDAFAAPLIYITKSGEELSSPFSSLAGKKRTTAAALGKKKGSVPAGFLSQGRDPNPGAALTDLS
jgi:hypothetical protein